MQAAVHLEYSRAFESIGGVIFDCDGVLVDSLGANRLFYNRVLERLNMPLMTPAQEMYVHAHHVQDSLAHIVPADRLPEANAIRATIDYSELLAGLRLEDGLRQLLLGLRGAGIRTAVNTNRDDTMEALLAHFDLQGFFSPVVTASSVAKPKPSPEGVFKILEEWSCKAEEVAYIGDTSIDEAAAKGAGVHFWAYKNPSLEAELCIRDFPALLRGFERGRE